MPKLLAALVLLFVVTTLAFSFYLPLKRYLVYKLNIAGDPTTSCCNVDTILGASGQFEEVASAAVFNNQTVDYPKTSLAQSLSDHQDPQSQVLGTKNEAGEEKWIEVSLAEQKLRAWEGNKIVREFLISSGLWYPTPKGDFAIWYKTRAQRMKGGSKELGTFYDLPNVPFNMFFYLGFGIHGTYWHNNFGHPMSHGCVNAPTEQAAWLFDWSGPHLSPGQWVIRATPENPGTRVFVH